MANDTPHASGRREEDRHGGISNEQIYGAIVRLEARADASAREHERGMAALNQRLEDKFGELKSHLSRQDTRLDSIETKVGVAHDNALVAMTTAKRAGAISGGSVSLLVQGLGELIKALLKP